jgi:hypothetical protein
MVQIPDMSPETRGAINEIRAAIIALCAKLDDDATVTDTDYEADITALLPTDIED